MRMKKQIITRLSKSIAAYFSVIKPRFKNKSNLVKWIKLCWIVYWLICGQSCYLNKIVENTPIYTKWAKAYENGIASKKINKNAQINKISNQLSDWILPVSQCLNSYLSYINKSTTTSASVLEANSTSISMSIEQRIYNTRIISHDTSDIQKPYARKMEDLCHCRDWSRSNSKLGKVLTGKWYLTECSTMYYQWRLYPLLVNLYSYEEEWFKSEKEKTWENIKLLNKHDIWNKTNDVSVTDRWYDDSVHMDKCLTPKDDGWYWTDFIIRWTSKRNVISQDEFHDIIESWEAKTKAYRENMFVKVENYIKHKMKYMFQKYSDIHPEYNDKNHPDHYKYKWFEIAYSPVYIKYKDTDPKDSESVVKVNLVAIRVIEWSKDENGDEIKGIDEDIHSSSIDEPEKLIYFYTSLDVNNIDDAVYILLVYLTRWYVETYIRYIKQVFDLEKVCIMKFDKIKNLCKLLPVVTNYLYKNFYNFADIQEKQKTQTLKSIFEKEFDIVNENIEECIAKDRDRSNIRIIKKRSNDTILNELLYFAYMHFIEIKWLTINPDSYARFTKDLMWDTIKYTAFIIRYDIYDP